MVGEKLSPHSSESIEKSSGKVEEPIYPPFDPDKAKELIANAKMLSSTEEISDDELRQKVLNQEEKLRERKERMERDEEVARLADEAEARLGRNLSQAELQDIAKKYDAWLKNPNKDTEQSPESENHNSQAETLSFDPTLYANESEWRAANPDRQLGEKPRSNTEYDFRNADRYQEDTFLLTAANSLVDSPDIMFIDHAMFDVKERASKDGTTVFEALKALSKESNPDEKGGWAAIDLKGAFIDATSTYVISKDEKVGRGLAKGLLTKLEMTIDGATTDKPNPQADKLRVDLTLIKPIAEEFIEEYNPAYDDPNAFRDHLKSMLEMEESDVRFAKSRGEQPAPNAERKIQAIKSVMDELARMQSNYEKNLKNLHDTAYANHRVIK